MSSRSEQINAVLTQLLANNGQDILGAAVASSDGMLIGAKMGSETNADRVGAIAATMMGVSSRVVNDLKIGKAEEAIIKAQSGYVLIIPVAGQLILALILQAHANLGLLRLEARDAGQKIADTFAAT